MEKEIINEFLIKYTFGNTVWYTVLLTNGKYISTQTPDNISEDEMNAQFNTPEAALCKDHVRINEIKLNHRKFSNHFGESII